MPHDPQETPHNWTEPTNSLLQPPPNQQPSHLETIPEQYSELSDDRTYSGSYDDEDSYAHRGEDEGHYDQPYSPQGMTAAQDHSAMRSPALATQPVLDKAAPNPMKDPMQTQKFSSASEAARKLEESRRGVKPPQPSNGVSPADHHAALRAHQLGVGGHTPMSSASAAAALYESTTNRNKAPKLPPAAKPPPQPANPPLPGKTAWTYPKPFTPNGHHAPAIPSDPSWIMTGGNAWSNKHRATKSTSAAAPGPGAAWPPTHPQQDNRGGWHQFDPRDPHQKIPVSQFHGVHSPQHQKHQSFPGHPTQHQQPVHHNESERWQAWGKEQHKQGGKGHHENVGDAGWGGGPTWDEDEEEEYDEWSSHKRQSGAGGGGWDDGAAWGMGLGRGQGMGRGQGQAHGNPQQMQGLAAQMKMQQLLAQQMKAQGGRGHSKEKVNDAAGQWGQGGGDWAQTGGDWGQAGAGGNWGAGKADNWGAKGDGWAAQGEGWAVKGDTWGAKADTWGAKADAWGNGKADNWRESAAWNSPMHAGHSADWSQHKAPSHSGKDAAGTRNVVSPQDRSQILNSLLNNSALNQGQPKINSSLTTKQHQQAAMLQAQLAAMAAAGGNPKVQQKTKMQQSMKANVWEADDGWGEVDSDGEEYGNRRVHFSPKESEVWGGSPRSIPSKSLATAAARNGIATTPLNMSSNVKFVESSGAAFSFVSEAFFGNTRLARERIHWLFPVDKDPRVAAMHQWVKKMSYNLGTFGVSFSPEFISHTLFFPFSDWHFS